MKVVPIPPNVLGVDCLNPLSPYECRALCNLGYKFREGYLDALTRQEIQGQLAAGLPLVLYTYANQLDPEHILLRCKALDIPQGAHIVLDVESVKIEAAALIDRVNACGERLRSQTLLPCMYFGIEALLTSAELSGLAVYRYHQGASRCRDRFGIAQDPARGCALIQGRPVDFAIDSIPGKIFDADFHRLDYEDDAVSALVAP